VTTLRVLLVLSQLIIVGGAVAAWYGNRAARAALHAAEPRLAAHYRRAAWGLASSLLAMLALVGAVVSISMELVPSSPATVAALGFLGAVFLGGMGLYLHQATAYDRGRKAAART
jgi:hypothetical protein